LEGLRNLVGGCGNLLGLRKNPGFNLIFGHLGEDLVLRFIIGEREFFP